MRSEQQAAFTFQAGQKGVASLDNVEQFVIFRVNQHPTSATMEVTSLIRQLLHKSRVESSGNRGGAAPPGVIKHGVQDFIDRALPRRELKDRAHAAGLEVVHKPSDHITTGVADERRLKVAEKLHLFGMP